MTNGLIIGGGPSITDNLVEYNRLGKFPGVVLTTDTSVERMIEVGFRDFYAVGLEDTPDMEKYYNPDAVVQHGKEILGGFIADRVHAKTQTAMEFAGIKVEKVPECKGYITSNVGLYAWLIATQKFKCDRVFMLGMDTCYAPGKRPKIDKNSSDPIERELYKYAVQELVNPHNGETLILTPEMQLWHEEMLWYCQKFPKVEVINCSGRGALYEKTYNWKPILTMKNWSDC